MPDDNITITINSDDTTLDSLSSLTIGNYSSINYSSTASPYLFSGSNGISYGTISTSMTSSPLTVTGDATFDGDIKWKGRSLGDMMEKIEKRLSILTPDPEKLEHFSALQKAYDHYKMLEKLCELPKVDDGKQ